MAARLAFSEFQWDGSGTCNETSCDGSLAINGMITKQSIHEANTRVQGIFGFDTNTANYISAFTNFSALEDVIDAQDRAKHGLMTLAWQYQARENNVPMMSILSSWLDDAFLKNQGQLYEDATGITPPQWDLKTLYTDAIAISNEIDNSDINISDAGYVAAVSSMQSELSKFTTVITQVKGGRYSDDLDEKILSAQNTVAKIQNWFVDYEQKNFVGFFDEETAVQIQSIEQKWESYQLVLGAELQSVFSPVVQLADYAIQCLATKTSSTECEASDSYVFEDTTASVIFDGDINQFIYQSSAYPDTNIIGVLGNEGDAGLIKSFTYTEDISVESDAGLAVIQSRSSNRASIEVTLESQISIGEAPEIKKFNLNWPKLTLKAKNSSAVGYQAFDFIAENIEVAMQGVKDPWRPNEPIHFNIERANISGVLADNTDRLIVDLVINSRNADQFYSAKRFPDLDFAWRASDFKRFMRFEDGTLENGQFAGWLEMPSDVVEGEVLSAAVQYLEASSYQGLPDALQDELNLESLFSFEFGELKYPGGATGLAIYKQGASNKPLVKQCEASEEEWRCSQAALLEELGCETQFKNDNAYTENASVADAFLFLKDDVNEENIGCIPQVKIIGRGVYDIEYGNITEFSSSQLFDVTLVEPTLLGLSSFSARLISNSNENGSSPIYFNVTGGINSENDVNLLISLTHGYYGVGNTGILGLEAIIPFGERTLWFLIGKDDSELSDALVYLILDGQVEITMTAFDYKLNNQDHSQPIGYIRYDEELVGILSKENGLYVVRYVNDTWQLL